MTFEQLVIRIRNMCAYGLSLDEIHDRLAPEVGEEMFFLAYCASTVLEEAPR